MVKIVNGVIQSEGESSPGTSPADDSTINICGYKLARWMPVAAVVVALFLFGIKGMLLFSGALFIAYTMSSGTTGSVGGQQVRNTPHG